MSLRDDIQKLAVEKPEFRRHLVPLLRQAAPDPVDLLLRKFKESFPRHVPGRMYPRSKMPVVVKWTKKNLGNTYRDWLVGEEFFGLIFKGSDDFGRLWPNPGGAVFSSLTSA